MYIIHFLNAVNGDTNDFVCSAYCTSFGQALFHCCTFFRNDPNSNFSFSYLCLKFYASKQRNFMGGRNERFSNGTFSRGSLVLLLPDKIIKIWSVNFFVENCD